MNTYQMVERIIELIEKGKIKVHDWEVVYQGWYKGIHIVVSRSENSVEINGVSFFIDNEQLKRARKAFEKSIREMTDKNANKKLQKAYDILRG